MVKRGDQIERSANQVDILSEIKRQFGDVSHIAVYGAGKAGRAFFNAFGKVIRSEYTVVCFLDKMASPGQTFTGYPVYTAGDPRLDITFRKNVLVIITIMISDFDYEQIVQYLTELGYARFLNGYALIADTLFYTNMYYVKTPMLTEAAYLTAEISEGSAPFPMAAVGRGSSIHSVRVLSHLNPGAGGTIHNVQIGAFCSLSSDISFVIDMNHDYARIATSNSLLVTVPGSVSKIPRKGQILIQNDVWIGYGANVMSGVTIRNGAVIAAYANVTKDIPPYAIVGGNPAKVIKYRFTDEQIADLLDIAWWDWDSHTLSNRTKDFQLPANEFISKYKKLEEHGERPAKPGAEYLFFTDFGEPYPIWEKVIRAYCDAFGQDPNTRLVIYIPGNTERSREQLETLFLCSGQGDITICPRVRDESELFAAVNYYITNRSPETIRRSCMADRYGVKTLSGVDEPLFWNVIEGKK